MNRRLTMCITLAALALIGVWSVHSVSQDLSDSDTFVAGDARGDTAQDDISSDGESGASDLEDLYSDKGSSDEAQGDLFDEPLPAESDDTLDEPSDDSDDAILDLIEPPFDDFPSIDDVDLGDPDGDDPLSDSAVDAGDDAAHDVLLPPIPVENEWRRVPVTVLGNSPSSSSQEPRQTRQKLAKYQQTVLQRYMQTKDKTKRDRLTEQLTEAVRQEFVVRQQNRTKELRALEQELKRLWSIHQQRDREANTIVRNRVRQLIRDKEGLGWGSESVSRRYR